MDLRRLDALIAEHLFGHKVRFATLASDGGLVVYTGDRDWLEPGTPYFVDEDGDAREVPHYSSAIAAAWRVVEKMRERRLYLGVYCDPDDYEATVHNHLCAYVASASAKTAPLAICLAALKALGVEVPKQ